MNPRTRIPADGVPKKKKKHNPMGKFVFTTIKMIIILTVALCCAIAGIVAGAVYGYASTTPPLDLNNIGVKNLTTFIYDKDGNEILKLTGRDNKDTEPVSYNRIPKNLEQAFIAVEDRTFETNPGIDIWRIGGAVLSGIKNGGTPEHGASTITQQVIKNTVGNTRQTLQRKVQEWVLALQLERHKAKWQIIETYMNIINMGHGKYGVQSASKYYFGKDVKELSLAECALLAGVTNSPGKYDPFGLTLQKSGKTGRENAINRQHIILKLMLDQKRINQQQYDEAMKEELHFAVQQKSGTGIKVQSYYVDEVIRQVTNDLMTTYNYSKNEAMRRIYNNGLKIYTCQDTGIQNYMDKVFNDDKYFKVYSKTGDHAQAAMVLMDPYGHVTAMYGGYGKKTGSNTLNRATQTERQPGSSFKPLAVYGPAIDLGIITPATVIDDVPVYMLGGKDKDTPYPRNSDTQYDGLTTIRNAIKSSINVVAAKVWRDHLGPDKSFEYLKKDNLDRSSERNVSLALGGLQKGVNPLQMAAAYAAFDNKGMYYEPTTYTKVLDSDGNAVLEKKQEYHEVYSEAAAFMMTNMMTEVVKPKNTAYANGGTASTYGVIKNAKSEVIPSAGKTGTTSKNLDKWFVGFSPYYVGAVWYGYDNEHKPITISSSERNNAQKIWNAVMTKVHENLEPKNWPIPTGVVKKKICIFSGKVPTDLCYKDPRGNAVIDEYFLEGTEPADDDICKVHVTAKVCKGSTDVWKRYLLAGPHCPLSTVIQKVFIQRLKPYITERSDSPYPNDWIYEVPVEYCTVHGASPTAQSEPKTAPTAQSAPETTLSSHKIAKAK